MASSGVNVLRWGSLVGGLFYGFSHQTAITSRDKTAAKKAEYDHQQKLISDAKAAFAEKTKPKTGDDTITDASHPQFDLEKYLTKVVKENP